MFSVILEYFNYYYNCIKKENLGFFVMFVACLQSFMHYANNTDWLTVGWSDFF